MPKDAKPAEKPTLGELVPRFVSRFENELYDNAARKAGYDPTSAYILGALTADHNDLEGPILASIRRTGNASKGDPGLVRKDVSAEPGNPNTLSQTAVGAERQKLLQDLITHYGKRFGKPQKSGEGDALAMFLKTT